MSMTPGEVPSYFVTGYTSYEHPDPEDFDVFNDWYAEEIRKAKEEAWDEAINFGMDIASELVYKYKPLEDNPYRKD